MPDYISICLQTPLIPPFRGLCLPVLARRQAKRGSCNRAPSVTCKSRANHPSTASIRRCPPMPLPPLASSNQVPVLDLKLAIRLLIYYVLALIRSGAAAYESSRRSRPVTGKVNRRLKEAPVAFTCLAARGTSGEKSCNHVAIFPLPSYPPSCQFPLPFFALRRPSCRRSSH